MSRRVVQDDGTNVSLLPFLAVLVCTMGALIILLVVVVQQARVSAETASLATELPAAESRPAAKPPPSPAPPSPARPSPAPPGGDPRLSGANPTEPPVPESVAVPLEPAAPLEPVEPLELAVEDPTPVEPQQIAARQRIREKLLWEIETLQASRDKTNARVEDGRLELSQVESHARSLRSQLDSLREDAERIQQAAASRAEISTAETQRLGDLRDEVNRLRQELEKVQQRNQQQSRSFAVVPYSGRQGTVRQPFYVECLGDGVVLQPEGIRLDISDLSAPLGPANPLAAALRQKRESLAAQRGGQLDSEPYPLLIVRPDGSSSYQRARVALQGWGTEFGYELIEADRPLVYPPVDPRVIPGMQEAIAQARQRQALERRVAKSVERQRSNRGALRASPRGGFVHYDGRPISSSDFATRAKSASESPPRASGQASGPRSSNPTDSSEVSSSLAARGLAAPELPPGVLQDPRELPADLDSLVTSEGTGPHGTCESQLQLGEPKLASAMPSTAAAEGPPLPRDAAFEWFPGDATGDARPPASAPDISPQASARPSVAVSTAGDSSEGNSASGSEGPGWALPNFAPDAIAITRPIYGNCDSRRLVIMPEAGSGDRPVEIRFDGATANVIEPFVGAIRQQIGQWGIAGSGVYWKPVLRFSVAPNAERQFVELQSQMRDSGIEILRR